MLCTCEDDGLNKNGTKRKIVIYACANEGPSKSKEIRKALQKRRNLIVEEREGCRIELLCEMVNLYDWWRGNVTGRVMVRNSMKDFFVSQVRHPFTSISSRFYSLFLTLLFFCFFGLSY